MKLYGITFTAKRLRWLSIGFIAAGIAMLFLSSPQEAAALSMRSAFALWAGTIWIICGLLVWVLMVLQSVIAFLEASIERECAETHNAGE